MSFFGGIVLLAGTFVGIGLIGAIPSLFFVVAGIGFTMPNSAALALSRQSSTVAGNTSALLGLTQFAIGGIVCAFSWHN